MDTSIPAPSPALDTVPDTPRRDKPRRKTKPTSPVATTPSKKPRGTVAASSPESPKSPIPGYVYISATTSSKSISQMSKVNLVNEIVKKQEPSDDIITVEQAEQFPIEKLIWQKSIWKEGSISFMENSALCRRWPCAGSQY